jgi:RNA polymerase primary sigma factor
LHNYYLHLDVAYEEILASSKIYQAAFDLGDSHQNQLLSLCEAHKSACWKMALKKTIFADFADEGRIKDVVSGKTKARVDDAMAIARLKVLLANNRKLETLIITGCQAWVEEIASKLPKVIGLEPEDLVSEGMVGLLKGIEGYDHELQKSFHQYSYRIVRNAMEAALNSSRYFVSVTMTSSEKETYSQLERLFVTADGKISDDIENFFKEHNISLEMQERMRSRLHFLIGDHIQFHGKLQAMESIVSENLETRGNPEGEKDISQLVEQIKYSLDTLIEREKEILTRRFGINRSAQTLDEVARELQMTRERVRQIEAKALRKLRHPTRVRMLEKYIELP